MDDTKEEIKTDPPHKVGNLQVTLANLAQQQSDLKAQEDMNKVKSFSTFGVDVTVTNGATTESNSSATPPPAPAAAPAPAP
jgi:hypothetical protein